MTQDPAQETQAQHVALPSRNPEYRTEVATTGWNGSILSAQKGSDPRLKKTQHHLLQRAQVLATHWPPEAALTSP